MHRTGLSPYGQQDEAVRWIAVRHGDDHIHLVAMLARQDGGKPSLSWERYKVRAACIAAEQRYGLRSTAPADRTAACRPTRAENEKAARRGLDEAPRITLRRQVITAAASANSEDEFFARLDQAGLLVRKRFSTRNPGQVTGYAVALPDDTTKNGGPVWYGGGKLAADLSWPKLRQRWTPPRATPGRAHLNRRRAERALGARHPRRRRRHRADPHPGLDDPAAAADAAWATSDTLHVAAAMLGSRILRQAADAYDRAARPPYGRIPPPTPAGNQLRQAARLLSAFACLTGDHSMTPIVLITRLAALAEAVAELRDTQQHAAQAAAARAAAEQLHAAARPAPPAQPRPAQRASTAAQLAGLSFPHPARRATPGQPGPARGGPHQCDGRHHPGHAALPADDASTHGSAHQNMTPAPECYATPGESIVRHLASAGCCMPVRGGVCATLTLAPVRPAWRRQSAHGHPRPMSQMVTAGQEVARRSA